jgi:hypothetical protein
LFNDQLGGYITLSFASADSVSAMLSQGYAGSSGGVDISAYDGSSLVYYQGDVPAGSESSFTPFSLSGIGPFTSVTIATFGAPSFAGIAQLEIEPASAAPEPSSWLLMIAGVGVVGAVLRRRGKTAFCASPTQASV